MRLSSFVFYAVLAFCAAFQFCAPAAAQTGGAGPRAEYELLFKRTLANPGDLDAAFKFAEVANNLGEYEAAIGALERMIFFNPGLSRVRLELGILYFRLGAYGQARAYLNSAIEAPNTPTDVSDRVKGFLSEIDRRDQPNQFSGFAQTGLRYQSTANTGPASLNVRALGFDATLSPTAGKRGDWNWFALGGFRHVFDFGNQRGDTWESTAQYYFAKQFRLSNFDISLAEVTSGPRLSLGLDSLPGWSVRPYGVVSGLGLGNRNYASTGGGGLSVAMPTTFISFEAGGEVRRRNFVNSGKFPTASQQTGTLSSAYVSATVPVMGLFQLRARAIYAVNRADSLFSFNSYTQPGVDVALAYEFTPPVLSGVRRWTLTPAASFIMANYKTPNPLIDPGMKRRDREFRAGVTLDAPVTDNFGFGAAVQLIRNQSSLPNYRYKNISFLFGPTGRF